MSILNRENPFTKKPVIVLILWMICMVSGNLPAQDIPGFNSSNYAGISGIDLQPACIADMKYRLNQTYFRNTYDDPKLNISQASWWELGFGYARVLKTAGHHFLKGGIRMKIEAGIEALYLMATRLKYSWNNNDTLNLYNSD